MKLMIIIFICFTLIFSAQATIIQILHTNDSHSFLDSTTHDKNVGGVARLKSLITFYKDKMKRGGVETLTLDAGDFTEGNLYFMADFAKKTFQAENNMGYDVVTMGNHDYLMGMTDLNNLLGDMGLNFSYLLANVFYNPLQTNCENIKRTIRPFAELEVSGIKFGILGVTTDEIYYKWRFECGKITNPIKSALLYEDILRARKNDVVIALTHLGIDQDIKLAHRSKELDLIIGGHSHSVLFKPMIVNNKKGKSIPILQAGYHTHYLGRMMIEVQKDLPLKILSYELVPVNNQNKDDKMNTLVAEANGDLESIFGNGWLDKEIGISDLKSDDPLGEIKWAYFITDTMREKTDVEIAVHSPLMNSEAFPVGKITRKSLINSFPRILDLHDPLGWSIYTTKIRGVWLQMALESLSRLGEPLVFSGITLKYIKTPIGIKLKQVLVNGKKINPFKNYRVALTEGVVRGAAGIGKISLAILGFPKKSPYRVWSTLEEKISEIRGSLAIENIMPMNHSYLPALE